MLEDCRRRYGDMFTLRITHEGTWVFLAHPDAVFEMKVVLRELVGRLALRASDPRPERITRRAITLVPDRGGAVVAERAA